MAKGKYVDGFLLVVPKNKLDAYRAMATKAGKIWKKYGALDYVEAVGEDLSPNMADPTSKVKTTTFPKVSKMKPGEMVVFSYIVFKSRKHRDQVNAKVMKDPYMNDPKEMGKEMPFDMKRMAYGGFEVIVNP